MSRIIRLILCLSVLSGYSPLNVKAATGHLFVNSYLKTLKSQSPDLYKNLTSDKNFKSAFCGATLTKSHTDTKSGFNSIFNKHNLTPNLYALHKLKIGTTFNKVPLGAHDNLAFQSLTFDIPTPPPRTV